MSDYRNLNIDYRDPDDPLRSDAKFDPDASAANAAWGWIAAAVFVVVVLAVAFGIGHQPGQTGINTASNDVTPPAATRMAPPAATRMGPPAMSPAPITPVPTPNSPAQGNSR
jgi:hypothetical protein